MNKHMIKLALVLTSQLAGGVLLAQSADVSSANTSTTKISAGAVAQAETKIDMQSMTQTQTSTAVVKPESATTKKFTLGLGFEYSQKVAVEEQGERESSADILLAPVYKINPLLTGSGKVVFSKETSGARQNSASNTTLALGIKGIKINESLETTHSLGTAIPTSEDSKKRDRLQGNISITNGLAWTNPYANVKYSIGLSKNFHEFTVNAEGTPNIEYRLIQTMTLVIPVTDKFSIETAGNYRLGRTYKGFERTAFEFSADLAYQAFDELSLNVGTTTDGNALKANGVDSNLSAYNENTSIIRAGITLAL